MSRHQALRSPTRASPSVAVRRPGRADGETFADGAGCGFARRAASWRRSSCTPRPVILLALAMTLASHRRRMRSAPPTGARPGRHPEKTGRRLATPLSTAPYQNRKHLPFGHAASILAQDKAACQARSIAQYNSTFTRRWWPTRAWRTCAAHDAAGPKRQRKPCAAGRRTWPGGDRPVRHACSDRSKLLGLRKKTRWSWVQRGG